MLDVVILCGGKGTRMSAVTGTLPKPMVPVGGKPLLWHVMRCFADQGCSRFVLCLGHLGDAIQDWVTRAELEFRVDCIDTGRDSLTGERLLRARELVSGPCFITYGDGVANVDLQALLSRHRQGGRLATVTAMRPRSRFGVVDIVDGQVIRFREKPIMEQRVSGGYFVFEPGAFEFLGEGPLEAAPLSELASSGQLSAYEHDGFWFSVDTPRDLAELSRMYEEGDRPWLRS